MSHPPSAEVAQLFQKAKPGIIRACEKVLLNGMDAHNPSGALKGTNDMIADRCNALVSVKGTTNGVSFAVTKVQLDKSVVSMQVHSQAKMQAMLY